MSIIKNIILLVAIFVSFNIYASPGHQFDSSDQNLDNPSPRRMCLNELIAPIARRSSVTSYIAAILIPALPPIPLQSTPKSPTTNRRHPASLTHGD